MWGPTSVPFTCPMCPKFYSSNFSIGVEVGPTA